MDVRDVKHPCCMHDAAAAAAAISTTSLATAQNIYFARFREDIDRKMFGPV